MAEDDGFIPDAPARLAADDDGFIPDSADDGFIADPDPTSGAQKFSAEGKALGQIIPTDKEEPEDISVDPILGSRKQSRLDVTDLDPDVDFDGQSKSKLSSTVNSFLSGVAGAQGQLARIPAYGYDLAALPQNAIAKYILKKPEMQVQSPDWLMDNPIAKMSDRAQEAFQSRVKNFTVKGDSGEEYELGFEDLVKAGDFGKAGEHLWYKLLENTPNTVMSVGLAITPGVGQAKALGTLGAMQGADSLKTSREKELDPLASTANAIVQSGAEIIGEKLGTFGILKWGQDIFATAGKQSGKEIIKNVLKVSLGSAFKGGNEEFWTQAAQSLSDKVYGASDIKEPITSPQFWGKLWWQSLEAGLLGMASEGSMTGPTSIGLGMQRAKSEKIIKEAQQALVDRALGGITPATLSTVKPSDAPAETTPEGSTLKLELGKEAQAANNLRSFEVKLLEAVAQGQAEATPAQLKHLFTAYPQDALAAGFDQETIDAVVQDDSITAEQIAEEAGTVKEFFEAEKTPPTTEPSAAQKRGGMTLEEAKAKKKSIEQQWNKLFKEASDDEAAFGKDSDESKKSAAALRAFEDDNTLWLRAGGDEAAQVAWEKYPVDPVVAPTEPEQKPETDQAKAAEKYGQENEARILQEYEAKHDNVISNDSMKKFFGEVGYTGLDSKPFQGPAGKITKKYFDKKIQEYNAPGKQTIFMTGGTGSGKSSFVTAAKSDKNKLIFDLNLTNFDTNKDLIQEAIDKTKDASKPKIAYVLRNPNEAYLNGVVGRAINPDSPDFNRAVPINEHFITHKKAMQTFLELVDHFGSQIEYEIIDNRGVNGEAVNIGLEELQGVKYNYKELENDTRQQVQSNDQIPDALKEALLSRSKQGLVQDQSAAGKSESQGSSQENLGEARSQDGSEKVTPAGPQAGDLFQELDQPAFFSALKKAIELKMPSSASADQVRGILKSAGVKQEEIDWLDIEGFLKGKDKVEKQALLDFIKANNVQIQEVVKGGQSKQETIEAEAQALFGANFDSLDQDQKDEVMDNVDTGEGGMQSDTPTKFANYQLPGGENYREILLTLPPKQSKPTGALQIRSNNAYGKTVYELYDSENKKVNQFFSKLDAEEYVRLYSDGLDLPSNQPQIFKSGHFDEPNILVHIRANDRQTELGKTLFLEEVQSDWHQKGRKEGYQKQPKVAYEVVDENGDHQAIFDNKAEADEFASRRSQDRVVEVPGEKYSQEGGVPDAPFKKSWHELALKRMLRYAAENGYDAIAWTTGEQQIQRYWGNDLIAPAVQRFVNITKPESVRKLGNDLFGRKMASLMSLDVVDGGMLSALKHDQVRRAVISALPVDVMDNLRSAKFSPEQLFSDPDMVISSLPVNHHSAVANGLVSAMRSVGTRLRAELGNLSETGGERLLLPALKASDLNAREVAGLLSPESIFHSEAGALPKELASARTGAEALSSRMGRIENAKMDAAELAGLLNAHAIIVHGREGLLKQGFEAPPGQGMKGFYDQIIPSFLNKYAKKWGGRVQDADLGGSAISSELKDFIADFNSPTSAKAVRVLYNEMDNSFTVKTYDKYGNPRQDHELSEEDFIQLGKLDNRFDEKNIPTDADAFEVNLGGDKIEGEVSEKVHALAITPSMRESVMGGQPLFQARLAKETASTFEEEARKVNLLLQRHGIERVVQLAAEIITPQGTKAFGVYRPKTKAVEIIAQPRKSTGFHEAFHAIEEEVLKVGNHSKKELYDEVKKQTGKSERDAREVLADAFAEYANKREAGTWSDKVVAFFEDILHFLRGLVGKADPRHTLFDSILNPKNPYKVRIDSTGDAMYEEMSDREAVAYKIAQGQKPTPEEMTKFPDLAKIYEDHKGLFTQIKIARYTGNPLSDALESQLKEVSKKLGFQPSMQATNNEIADVDAAGKTEDEQKKIRGFIETVKESHRSPPKIQDTVATTQKAFYSVIPNAQTILEADNLIKTDPNKAMSLAKNGKIDRTNFAVAVRLIHAANAAGQYEQAIDIIDSLSARATAAGQAVQVLSLYNKLTPDGIVFYAQRLAVKGNRELQENGRQPKYGVPPDLAIQLKAMATKIQAMKEGREKTLETAKLMKLANSVIPPSMLSKISSFQTIMQLLNMKTLMRNLIGNAGFFVMENISDTVAATLDMVVGVATNQRTQLMPKYGVQLQGAKIGFIEGVQDAIAGVDTSQTNTKFDLQPTTMFTDPILGSLEKALSISLRAPDRAFFQAAFDQELSNQLRAAGKTVPTMEMLDRARYEGLRRTFQDDNVMSRVFTGLKKILNARQQWGLGDMVIKYPKTPANILMRGIEYSPFNFVHTVGTLAGPLFGQKFDQRKFVQSTSRALVGSSLLIGTGFILASLGILRGRPDRDRDAEAMMRDMGMGSYTINLSALSRFFASGLNPEFAAPQAGDVASSYDWFQPQAIGLAIGANLYHNPEGHQALEDMADVISSGVTTLIDQPLMQGIRGLTQGYDSQSMMDNVFKILEGVPASFVPTLLNQVKQLKDNTSRNMGDVNYFKRMYNRAAYRIPFASETLEPRITIWGNEQQFYQDGSNNPFNVFVNPAFINRYKPNPEAKMVLDIWRSTGIKTHFPRVADKKQVINGERVELEPEQYTQFQRYIGHKTGVLYSALADNPKFMNGPDELKAKLLSNYLTDISTAGKILILGHRPKRASMKVRALVAGGV